eukprot:1011467-Alexandrium_andersonii.AAC.1
MCIRDSVRTRRAVRRPRGRGTVASALALLVLDPPLLISGGRWTTPAGLGLSLIHISEPTRLALI